MHLWLREAAAAAAMMSLANEFKRSYRVVFPELRQMNSEAIVGYNL